MRIQVVSARDGRHELINLLDPVEIQHRDDGYGCFISAGIEHWFNSDGTYDGWSMDLENTTMTPDEVTMLLLGIEKNRVFL